MRALIVLSPFINSLIFIVGGNYVQNRFLFLPVFTTMILSILSLIYSFPSVVAGDVTSTSFGAWMYSGLFEVDWMFGIDALTYIMLLVVLTVSSLVHLYSTEYMSEDPHLPRFISYLSLFTFFMLILITSENLVSLFLGWEGVGLCSYLLISFWFTRVAANKAAIKAMVVNRVADLALTIGILATFFVFQTIEFSTLFGLAPFMSVSPLSAITLLLFLGAMGKSAQIGLHTWLPDAMEGPTPVSALIHAATMVTAGVFLIIRCSALFERTPDVLLFVTFIGAATAFMAATSGLLQNDLKKIIAYSTCSQLGYMVFICGLSGYAISFFHLTNHAFFKALLFLSAGAVIHAVSNEQDLRRLGGLLPLLPYTYIMFLIGSLALMGFPFLTGFYSKDLILEIAASSLTLAGTFAYSLGLITALFTAFYSFRLLYLAFYSAPRSPRVYLVHAHELTERMAFSLAVLSIGSIFFGFVARDLFIGLGTAFWNGVIPTSPLAQLSGEFLNVFVKLAPLFGSTAAVFAVFFLSVSYHSAQNRSLFRFFSHKWYFDTVYNRFINQPLLQVAYHDVFKPVDKGLLELAGPTGFGRLAVQLGRLTTLVQTGRVYDYALIMFAVLLAYIYNAEVTYMFAPWVFYRTGKTGSEHFTFWFTDPAVRPILKKALPLIIGAPVVASLIAAHLYYRSYYIVWEFGWTARGIFEALYLPSMYLPMWFAAVFFMLVITILYEHTISKFARLVVRTISYILSFGFIPLYIFSVANAFSCYCVNRTTSLYLFRYHELKGTLAETRALVHAAIKEEVVSPALMKRLTSIDRLDFPPMMKYWFSVPSDYVQVIRPLFDPSYTGTFYMVCFFILFPALVLFLSIEIPATMYRVYSVELMEEGGEARGIIVMLLLFYWSLAAYIMYYRWAHLFASHQELTRFIAILCDYRDHMIVRRNRITRTKELVDQCHQAKVYYVKWDNCNFKDQCGWYIDKIRDYFNGTETANRNLVFENPDPQVKVVIVEETTRK